MATYELHFMCWTFGNQSHDPLMITREVKQLLYNYMKFCQTMQEFGQPSVDDHGRKSGCIGREKFHFRSLHPHESQLSKTSSAAK